jgi:hypothetical protein
MFASWLGTADVGAAGVPAALRAQAVPPVRPNAPRKLSTSMPMAGSSSAAKPMAARRQGLLAELHSGS